MLAVADEPISDWRERPVAGAKREALEPLRSGLRLATITRVVIYTPQEKENVERGANIVQALGGIERLGQEQPDSFVRTHRINQRSSERDIQLHSEGRVDVRLGLKTVHRALDTLSALDHQ